MTEYAEGIPRKRVEPIRPVAKEGQNEAWTLSLSEHDAERAGKHYDLRLVDPVTDQAHSWALPAARWPDDGEKIWAVPQPTHTGEYARKKGKWKVETEYGKGEVESKAVEPVEIVEATDKKITFNRYPGGQKVERLSIIPIKDGALLYNHTPVDRTIGTSGGYRVPTSKKKYKEIDYGAIDTSNDGEVIQAKMDGAHLVAGLQAHKPMRVFSYRESKKLPVIEHTPRFPSWHRNIVPSGLGGTVVRAEGWASDKKGKALPVQEVAALLNSGVWKSKQKQREKDYDLRLSIIDIDKFKGRDMSGKPFKEKLPLMRRLVSMIPGLEMPPTAETKEEKDRLVDDIRKGKLKETREGVVIHNLDTDVPIKAKINKDYDGKVVGIFKGKGKYEGKGAGGLIVEEENSGKRIRVGSGLKDRLRKVLHDNPKILKGMVVRMRADGQYPSGRLRMPRYKGLHPDKNDPKRMQELLKKKLAEASKKKALNGAKHSVKDNALRWMQNHAPEEYAVPIALGYASGAGASGLTQLIASRSKDIPLPKGKYEALAKAIGLTSIPNLYVDKDVPFTGMMHGKDVDKTLADVVRREMGSRYKSGRPLIFSNKMGMGGLAHELGHAKALGFDKKLYRRLLQGIHSGIAPLALAAAVHSGIDKPERTKYNPAIMGAVSLPLLFNEAEATVRGIKGLKRLGIPKSQVKSVAKDLAKSWGTYGGIAAAAVLAPLVSSKARKYFKNHYDEKYGRE